MDDIDQIMQEAGREPIDLKKEDKVDAPEVKQDDKPVETPPEDKKQDVPTDNNKPTEEPVSNEFNIETFNKAFGREFKSKEDIDNLFAVTEENQSIKAKLEEYQKQLEEKDAKLKEHFNPLSYFANEQQYKVNKVLKDNPELNEAIVGRVLTSNLDELSDKDVLKLNDMIGTKGIFDERIVEMDIEDRYGLNVQKEDLDDDELRKYQVKEYRMKKDAEKARMELKKLSNVELPEIQDPEVLAKEKNDKVQQLYEENKGKWQTYANQLVDKFTKLEIPYKLDDEEKKFDFEVDKDFLKSIQQTVPEIAARSGKDLNNPQDVAAIEEMIQKNFLWINRGSILKNAIEDTISKMTEEEIKKYHNPTKPKSEDPPKTLNDKERFNQEQRAKMLNDEKL